MPIVYLWVNQGYVPVTQHEFDCLEFEAKEAGTSIEEEYKANLNAKRQLEEKQAEFSRVLDRIGGSQPAPEWYDDELEEKPF